ncbi:MAG: glycosyltransferase family 1 protein [Deltaproteobacteria bacterium]|nr:glycosyltransferase family 1 protein [Deltaproteobacteria bacterium]
MIAGKYAVLSTLKDGFLNDLGNGYIREFVNNGALFIDYEEEYLKRGSKRVQEHIFGSIKERGIEALIYQASPSDFHFSLDFFRKLQDRVYTVMMLGDSDHYFDIRDIYYAQCMDLVVVYDCLSRYRFRQYGIDSISFYSSFDMKKYKKAGMKKTIDVSFVGDVANKIERQGYLDFLRDNGVSVEVFGTGTRNGQISLDEMVRVFNSSKINLNFTKISLRNAIRKEPLINLRLRQVKGRIIEAALCGGFVLTEYVPGIEEVFEPGREIAAFDSREEMLEKTRYFLRHDKERDEIAFNGFTRATRDYDVEKAIPALISRIDDMRGWAKKKRGELLIDPAFSRNFVTFRAELISRLIKLKRWDLAGEELGLIFKGRGINLKKAAGILLFNFFPALKKIYLRLNDAA